MSKSDYRINPNFVENRIPLELVHGMATEDKEKYISSWKNSTYVTEVIKKVILEKIDKLAIDENTDYMQPNWAYERADKNGQIKSLKYILRLLP